MGFQNEPKKNQGTLLSLGALFIFAVSDTTAKYLSVFFAVPLLAWARYLPQLIFHAGRHGADHEDSAIVCTDRPWLMILRGLMQVASTVLVLLAFQRLPLARLFQLSFSSGPLLGGAARRVAARRKTATPESGWRRSPVSPASCSSFGRAGRCTGSV